ncbi:ABC transporter ATP-binding protein [Corynebacterium bovis]|uniref:ABC transporter ATP-binding protein n=1 Tax=Corynebacterium bovis TaxID=36808 RepID=UPI00313A31DB
MSDGHAPDRATDDARPGMLSVRHVTKAFSGTGSRTAGDATGTDDHRDRSIRRLARWFRSVTSARPPVLDDISFDLPLGQVHGLVGRNGVGKTTLLRIMAGQLCSSGTVSVDGRREFDNPEVLGSLILAGADVPLPRSYTVGRVLAVAARRWRTWDDDLATRLVRDFRLETRKKVGDLSRGQRSMVGIVTGLAAQAPVTLLDEPYLGLDVENRDLFYRHLLHDIERNPRTVVMSTHHIDDASRVLDSVMLMADATVREVVPVDDLTARMRVLTGSSVAVGQVCSALAARGQGRILLDDATGGARRVTVDMAAAEAAGTLDGLASDHGVRVTEPRLDQAVLALGAGERQ